MMTRIFKRLAPLAMVAAGLAASVGLSGCDGGAMTINGEKGVPLADLDMSGAAPSELVVAANATVILTVGDTLDITIEDDPEGALRFILEDETLAVTIESDMEIRDGNAVVRVTMPAPGSIVIAGSGSVEAAQIAASSDLTIAGSGSIIVTEIAADTLDITIGGSGSIKGAGTVDQLEITIGGSGNVDLTGLKTETAEISIGGSGSVAFASDGVVDATIAGAGNISVTGSAKCTVEAVGSGTLSCGPAAAEDAAEGVS